MTRTIDEILEDFEEHGMTELTPEELKIYWAYIEDEKAQSDLDCARDEGRDP